jgi:hypothetical protein
MILAGTYLSPQAQSYSIWSLNLGTLTWARIETGNVFSTGSWNRGVLHEGTNRFLVFGNQHRGLLEDYNHRQNNFDHIAVVDLEAFGVYQLPRVTCSTLAQEMGLSLLNEPAVSDFLIVTRENQNIPVNSAVLAQRWPYFGDLMETNKVRGADDSSPKDNDEYSNDSAILKSHSMLFPYSYPVVIALLQFIYTDNLLTAQQYQPHILAQLLLLSDMYELPRLRILTTHALHQMLNMSTAPLIFETAALSHQTSLQIRALKMMIAAKKMIQQQQMIQAGINMDMTPGNTNLTSLPMTTSSSAPTAAAVVASTNQPSNAGPNAMSPSTSLPSTGDSPSSFMNRQQQRDAISARRSPSVQQQHLPDVPAQSRFDRYTSPTPDSHHPHSQSQQQLHQHLQQQYSNNNGNTNPLLTGRATAPGSPGHRYSSSMNNTNILSPPMSANSMSNGGTGAGSRVLGMSPPSTPRQNTVDLHARAKKDKKKGTGMTFFGGKLF